MKKNRRIPSLAGLLTLLWVAGCAEQSARPPVTMEQYERFQARSGEGYPRQVIVLFNLQRALDPDLPMPQRVASLRLTTQLGGSSPLVLEQVASLLTDPRSSADLRLETLNLLLKKDYADMGPYVVQALPLLRNQPGLRDAIFEWLAHHPQASALSEVVKLWASEPVTGPDEVRLRLIVEKMTGMSWQQGLLDAINREEFYARGSAIEILTARLPKNSLRLQVMQMTPRTRDVTAMKLSLERFDYFPSSGRDLLMLSWISQMQSDHIPAVADLVRRWRAETGYRFVPRDFCLLSRLAEDPARVAASRSELIFRLGKSLESRQHVARYVGGRGRRGEDDLFAAHLGSLSMIDLWNLSLLDEMLGKTTIQRALRVVSEKDRADPSSEWGGLVMCEKGQAVAKLYQSSRLVSNDLAYVPTEQFERDSRDTLCRFVAHFEKVENARRAGPTAEELDQARRESCYGLVLTSLNEYAFCAHYYNWQGLVVSLGKFPLRP